MMNTNPCLFSNYLYTCLVDVIIIQARIHLYLQIPGTSKLQQSKTNVHIANDILNTFNSS